MAKKAKKKGQKESEKEFRWCGFTLGNADPALITRHLLWIIVLSVAVKFATFFFTTEVFSSFIDTFDISYYLKYAVKTFSGQVPYVDFSVDYPQFALFSILAPFLFALLTGAGETYLLVHQILMAIFDAGTAVLVYLIALKIWDQRRAFLSGIIYAAAFSSAYFVLTKYDAYPTFFLMLAVALFVYGREMAGYLAAVAGFLVKWFPALALPFFLVHDIREGRSREEIFRRVGISAALVVIVTIPFLLLAPSVFIRTYTVNTGFNVLTHSLVYYLDFITGTLFSIRFFGEISLLLTVLLQLALIYLYYRHPSRGMGTLCGFIFLSVLGFILTNKIASPQYFAWVTPFLAIFLAGTIPDLILFFAAQLWTYLEFPLLYNTLYNNITGFGDPGAGFPVAAFSFFTLKFVIWFALALVVARRSGVLPLSGAPSS